MPPYDDRRFVPPAPIARVVVRHAERQQSMGDVPMLIDSGADATLLPTFAVSSLGLEGTGERYQLVGFDGTMSESEAVYASLAISGRNFRGRYLLTDAEVGVIGRDILNHLRLLLDGPAMNWEEHP
jgi:Aspartyl protease